MEVPVVFQVFNNDRFYAIYTMQQMVKNGGEEEIGAHKSILENGKESNLITLKTVSLLFICLRIIYLVKLVVSFSPIEQHS